MTKRPIIAIIAAVARNGAIGAGNSLVWRSDQDQQHFRRVTMGCPVIMGRKTWESLPARFRPLPGRRNIVVTRDATWHAPGAETAVSLDAARALVADAAKAFVIGGGELYAQAVPEADELVLTEIEREIDGDTFFPTWDRAAFDEVEREQHDGYSFARYRRRT